MQKPWLEPVASSGHREPHRKCARLDGGRYGPGWGREPRAQEQQYRGGSAQALALPPWQRHGVITVPSGSWAWIATAPAADDAPAESAVPMPPGVGPIMQG